jgi:hypothetical protein
MSCAHGGCGCPGRVRSASLRTWWTSTTARCSHISHRPARSRSTSSLRPVVAGAGRWSSMTALRCCRRGLSTVGCSVSDSALWLAWVCRVRRAGAGGARGRGVVWVCVKNVGRFGSWLVRAKFCGVVQHSDRGRMDKYRTRGQDRDRRAARPGCQPHTHQSELTGNGCHRTLRPEVSCCRSLTASSRPGPVPISLSPLAPLGPLRLPGPHGPLRPGRFPAGPRGRILPRSPRTRHR